MDPFEVIAHTPGHTATLLYKGHLTDAVLLLLSADPKQPPAVHHYGA